MSFFSHGTVKPAYPFDSMQDAQSLRAAMKGFGTREDKLIAVICRRSNHQLQEIKSQFKTLFGRDLAKDIKSETNGNFRNLLLALLMRRVDFYVQELHDAMEGVGTDEDALVEILCSLSNNEIQTLKTEYQQKYQKDLESELCSETSGHFKKMLVSICAANRDESVHVNQKYAEEDAMALFKAGVDKIGTDESMFNQVLCQRSYAQIRLICVEYERQAGHSLRKAIDKEFSGSLKKGLKSIVHCSSDKPGFFAERLYKSMDGIGTNDSQLIRVVVIRCELDLADVKTAFEKLYGKTLKSFIKGDTNGFYKRALYSLIGETS